MPTASEHLAKRGPHSRAALSARQAGVGDHAVALLRERVYGAIGCLATMAALMRYTTPATSAWTRLGDVLLATGSLWAAAMLADWLAHLGVHRCAPRGRGAVRMLAASGQIVAAAVLPMLTLVAAGVGAFSTYTAMWLAMWLLVVELGVIALLAVRRAQLALWQKLLTIAALTGIGAIVVGIKILAH